MIGVFRVFVPTSIVGLLVSETILGYFCYLSAGILMYELDPWLEFAYEGGWLRVTIAVASLLIGIYFTDLYSDLRVASRLQLFQGFCLIIGVVFLVQALIGYASRQLVLGRWQMMTGSLLALVLFPAWRILYSSVVMQAMGQRRVLFLGDHALARQLAGRIGSHPELGMTSIGYLAEAPAEGQDHSSLGVYIGSLRELRSTVERHKPDLIVTGLNERRSNLPIFELLDLRLRGTMIEDSAVLYERLFGRVSVQTLRPSQLVFSSSLGPNPQFVALQQLYSFLLALVGALLTLPVMLLVSVLVKATSRGPVIYKQRRVGLQGREFFVYKFRSMYQDAEARSGAVWAAKNDPRITPLGRWLRKLRLDELPQFFNVIKGDMALVGPRPERPEFVRVLSQQIPFYQHRHCVKPGVTGWAQINHKYGDTIEDTITKLEYDLYYIKNLSPALDLYIAFHTAKVMLLSRGSR